LRASQRADRDERVFPLPIHEDLRVD